MMSVHVTTTALCGLLCISDDHHRQRSSNSVVKSDHPLCSITTFPVAFSAGEVCGLPTCILHWDTQRAVRSFSLLPFWISYGVTSHLCRRGHSILSCGEFSAAELELALCVAVQSVSVSSDGVDVVCLLHLLCWRLDYATHQCNLSHRDYSCSDSHHCSRFFSSV